MSSSQVESKKIHLELGFTYWEEAIRIPHRGNPLRVKPEKAMDGRNGLVVVMKINGIETEVWFDSLYVDYYSAATKIDYRKLWKKEEEIALEQILIFSELSDSVLIEDLINWLKAGMLQNV